MKEIFLISLQLQLQWFFEALSRRGRELTPLTLHRLAVLLLLFPLYLLYQAWNWLCLFLDEILFPNYRDVEVKMPLFVAGIPRSGTTFIHRTLAGDGEQFTTFTTWQAILAPTICQRRLITLLSRMDDRCGSPCRRFLDYVTWKLTGKMEHIHAVGLNAAEEDYLTLLPAAGCFIMMTAFPASESVWNIGSLNRLSPKRRKILLFFYKACLQKHLYDAPTGIRLLSKNAAFASWLDDLYGLFPDARFLLCIRDPRQALSSQLSSLAPGLSFFGSTAAANKVAEKMGDIFCSWYENLLDATQSLPITQYAIIDQGQLQNNTRALLEKSLHHLKIPISAAMEQRIEEAAKTSRSHKSNHVHNPKQSLKKSCEPAVLDLYNKIYRVIH